MKKILFNDRYGLTQAVIDGHKTQTRRIIPQQKLELTYDEIGLVYNYCKTETDISSNKTRVYFIDQFGGTICFESQYVIGQELAIAQSYEDILDSSNEDIKRLITESYSDSAAFKNKLYVRSELMPHAIQITGIRVERLNKISDDDVRREGIRSYEIEVEGKERTVYGFHQDETIQAYDELGWAYIFLIDKICGKGTWNSNPYVFVYDFELIK